MRLRTLWRKSLRAGRPWPLLLGPGFAMVPGFCGMAPGGLAVTVERSKTLPEVATPCPLAGDDVTQPPHSLAAWLACQHCDALLHEGDVPEGKVARCPHCGSVLYRHKRQPVQRTLAFSLAGLLLYFPANFLPIMSFEMLGNDATNTMIKGVVQLWQQGYYWMAFLVCLCSMIMPLLELTSLFVLSFAMGRRRFWHWHRHLLRVVHRFSEWGMLEVYMLGILVAFIKMSDLGDIHLGVALFCFVGLLVCSMGAALSFDAHACWQRLEQSRRMT